jgi:hypothetical protein
LFLLRGSFAEGVPKQELGNPGMELYVPARCSSRTELKAKIDLGKVNELNYDLQLGKK